MISSLGKSSEILSELPLREVKLLNVFFIGFILYCFGFAIRFTDITNYYLISGIQLLGMSLFLPATLLLINFEIRNIYLRILFFIYFIYVITVIFRGFSLSYYLLRDTLFDGWFGIFIYLVPIVCLFPKNLYLTKKLFVVINICSAIFLLLVIFFSPLLILRGAQVSTATTEVFSRTLGITAGLILLTYPYHKMKMNLIAGTVISVIFFLATYQARRSLIFYCLIILIITGIIYLSRGKKKIFVLVLTIMVFTFAFVFGTEFLSKSSFLSFVLERGTEDTRSNVENRFYEDMEGWDWIIGRGMNGEYYCPGIMWDGVPSVYRNVIETDFLQIILKGGIISLALLLLIFIPAVFLGLFKSNNLLVKAGAIWILLGIINMYPSTVNTFTLNYIIMWLFVGFIYDKNFRMLSDQEIKKYLNNVS